MRTAVIVPAAGRGERLGPGIAKALRTVGSHSLLELAVSGLTAARGVDVIVVVAPADAVAAVAASMDALAPGRCLVVAGGATRQQSVAAGLAAVPADVDCVLVHDAARALTPPALTEAVIAAVAAGAAAVIPALPVADTMKQVQDGLVVRTVDRSLLRAVQTPQGFTRETLAAAHAHAQAAGIDDVTDDAGLAEAAGFPVQVIAGHEHAFKITRPLDLLLAQAVLAARVEGEPA